ncbi:hypothetical protein B0H12DRAFT_1324979 [Mycena haematopus]|nr:hypothetical protein B0H12DRAFT_1324979 [Mycena haematopus]
MTPQDRFPNELWLEVFAQLSPDAHRSLSSTHRTLYDIARPFGFVEFKLYPYPYEFQPPNAQLDDALERLRFWTSPRIAPHVRSCVARQDMYRWQGSTMISEDDEPPHVLMDAFFERLPLFTGLERLCSNLIRFTRTGITNLCELPRLSHVELFGSTVAPGEHIDPAAVTLRVASFLSRYDYHMNEFWISLLSRDTLRELEFSNPLALARPEVQPFPNVHTLRVNDSHYMAHDTLAIYNKFPNLRTLQSNYGVLRNLTPAEESSIFPVLKEFIGAYQNLHIFLQRPTLTHITVDAGFPFRNLATELQGVTALPNITSLTVRFTTSAQTVFGKTEIDTLFTLFPNLANLEITLHPDAEEDGAFTPQATSFLPMLASNPLLPSTLQSLSLEWDFPFQYGSTDSAKGNDPAAPDPADVPDFAILRTELLAKCPALTYIFLDGYHFLFLWWKTSWVWEATAHNYDDADVLRAQKAERKYGPPVWFSTFIAY